MNAVKNLIVPGCRLTMEGSGDDVDNTIYKKMVGRLTYLTFTRPDLMFSVCLISRYLEKPTHMYTPAVKKILRYLRGTVDLGIFYGNFGKEESVAFTDSDYVGDVDDRKNTSSFAFIHGSETLSWSPAFTASCVCQAIWLWRVLDRIGNKQRSKNVIFCDNNSTINLSINPVLYGRSKHIGIRFHFLRDSVRDEVIELLHYNSEDQFADIATKPLKLDAFQKLSKLGKCRVEELH